MVLPKWVTAIRPGISSHRNHSQDPYEACPLCGHGNLSTLMMMDAMSCDFCRHIFSIDVAQPMVQEPILRIEDSSHPLAWQWSGDQWQALSQVEQPLILWLWSLCAAIALIPSTLMGLAIHLFPSTPHSQGAWFSELWLCFTIGGHCLAALWLLAEHYQWPFYCRLKLRFGR